MESADTVYEREDLGAKENFPPALGHYRNARVTIHYNTGVSDTGLLTYLDRSWAELLKDNGERLLIPLQAIRILKMVKAAETSGDANILLRAAEAHSLPDTTMKQIGPK